MANDRPAEDGLLTCPKNFNSPPVYQSKKQYPTMKLNHLFTLARTCRVILLATLALFSAGALKAANFFDDTISGINFGNASGGATAGHKNWAIFALSGGVTITDPTLDGSFDVLGNVAIGGAGVLTMSASRIQGYYNSETSTPVLSGGANNTGYTSFNSVGGANGSYVNTGVTNANSASTTAAGLGNVTGGLAFGGAFGGVPSTVALNNTGASISGAAGQTYVLNLTDLILSGAGAILTLSGTSTTNYVINVNRYMTLSSSAQIALSGGIGANNVLFNVKSNSPSYDVTLSGASVVNGIILAPSRNVKLTGASVVYGEVIAKGVSLSGRSKVINPYVSP